MKIEDVKKHFGLFVRAVEGHLVTRYGAGINIGATKNADGTYSWDTKTVHAITHSEAQRFAREYGRAIDDGALVKVDAEDFAKADDEAVAQSIKDERDRVEAIKKAEADAKAAAKLEAEAKAKAKAAAADPNGKES